MTALCESDCPVCGLGNSLWGGAGVFNCNDRSLRTTYQCFKCGSLVVAQGHCTGNNPGSGYVFDRHVVVRAVATWIGPDW